MSVATDLLNAKHVGVRDLKEHLSKRLRERKPIIVTDHGTPTKVILSYQDVVELIEILDELQDRQTLEAVRAGREAIRKGTGWRSVSDLFNEIRQSRE